MAREHDTTKFSKTDPRYWERKVFLPKKRMGKTLYEGKIYSVRIQVRGHRETFSTGESSKREAGKKALEIFLAVRGAGWEAARLRHKGTVEKMSDLTVGDFLMEVQKVATASPRTLATYGSKFRRIVADIANIKPTSDKQKHDYFNGGSDAWRTKVDSVRLARITPERVTKWKKQYLTRASADPRDQIAKKRSVNSVIRNAKALFSQRNLSQLGHLELPTPLPFEKVAFEAEGSYRYRSLCDPRQILAQAWKELHEASPDEETPKFKGKPLPHDSPYRLQLAQERSASKREAFKILLLALSVGLRRNEIDKLQWSQFRWAERVIIIETTDCFEPKADSAGDMPVDDEILAFFRERFSESESRFVIAGSEPKPDSSYQHYRAYKHERTLLKWLRGKGIACHNPIHALRKEYGTLVCQEAGIYVASRLLRHSDIRITSQHYVDQKERVVSGLGGTFSAIASTTHQGKTEDDAAA